MPGIFVSYSHTDKRWLLQFETHIKPLVREGLLAIWDDRRISPGAKWREEIDDALKSAELAVLLVTPNFLQSDFIAKNELPPILAGKKVFWIAVEHCNYEATQIAAYQCANNPARPLESMSKPERNKTWVEICRKLVDVANPLVPLR